MTDLSELKNYLPFKIITEGDNVLIDWIDSTGLTFSEPMFKDSIAKAKKSGAAIIQTGTTELSGLIDQTESIQPSGFIFHVSRCGSTLVSNMLKKVKGNLVISEPGPVNDLLITSFKQDMIPPTLISSFKALIRVFGIERRTNTKTIVIKFTSWNTVFFEMISKAYPSTPVVFIFRDPYEVLCSLISKPPAWAQFFFRNQLPANNPDNKKQKNYLQFLIELLERTYIAGVEMRTKENVLLIDYAKDKMDNIKKVLRHFNLSVNDSDWQDVVEQSSVYSKSKNATAFKPDLEKRFSLNSLQPVLEKSSLPVLYEKLRTGLS